MSREIQLKIYGEIPENTDLEKLETYFYYDFERIDVKRVDVLYDSKDDEEK